MKRILMLVICALLGTSYAAAQFEPEWIKQKPLSYNEYVGVASAPLSNENCREIARAAAFTEIAAQICVNVESSSFLKTTELNGVVKDEFERNIALSLSNELSDVTLVDSYETSERYYAYYCLDKDVYRESVAKKIALGTAQALDMLESGAKKEAEGELVAAMSDYADGLQIVEPYLNYEMLCQYNGTEVNVATELYLAYKGALNGMTITTDVEEVDVESLSAQRQAVSACLSKDGKRIANMLMRAEFATGDGDVTPPTKTNNSGTTHFYITNVTSKETTQSLKISVDKEFLSELPKAYKGLVISSNLPTATVILNVKNSAHKANFRVLENQITGCESVVRSILANNYFEVTDNSDAELYIEYSTNFKKGGTVEGDMYTLRECFGTLSLKIYKSSTRSLVAEYSLPEQRILVPENKTKAQMVQTCAREMSKRFRAELPRVLRTIKL